MHTTLIETGQLADLLAQHAAIVLDCRFDVSRPDAGEAAWRQGHIPGACYVHLDADMAAAPDKSSGRHPLPDPEFFRTRLEAFGIAPETQVVVYDDAGGAIAGRMWWLLRWVGHAAVAVLDGGLPKWVREARPLSQDRPAAARASYPVRPNDALWVSTAEVEAGLERKTLQVVDARDPDRFAGRVEPLDAKAGHIPGSQNLPFRGNLNADGTFRSRADLRARFAALSGTAAPVCHSCGSGVTACHNLLAMAHAGLEPGRLYVGSWSAWIRDPQRPIAAGDS